ncbi:unnamed protein product [Arabidopsis arenosa]|uniref:Uncharacterized protein n=1 Tax=Arabidopsis arenosa TaxID=38785 RepID=A0A8S2A9G9_ARAAE|nr:unnamed protein product [Arabidopsis arenosa]
MDYSIDLWDLDLVCEWCATLCTTGKNSRTGSAKGLNILEMDMVDRLNTDQSVLHDMVRDNKLIYQDKARLKQHLRCSGQARTSKILSTNNNTFLCITRRSRYSDRSRDKESPDQSSSGNLGPRQRAAALAALTSAFNSSSGKTSSPELQTLWEKEESKKISSVFHFDGPQFWEPQLLHELSLVCSCDPGSYDSFGAAPAPIFEGTRIDFSRYAPIFEDKEPPQFVALFNIWLSLRKVLHQTESVALIKVSGTGVHNSKALQVEANLKRMPVIIFFLAKSAHDYCQAPKRGNIERSSFWFAIGGKQNFTSKKVYSETVRDSHLVSFSLNKGNFVALGSMDYSIDLWDLDLVCEWCATLCTTGKNSRTGSAKGLNILEMDMVDRLNTDQSVLHDMVRDNKLIYQDKARLKQHLRCSGQARTSKILSTNNNTFLCITRRSRYSDRSKDKESPDQSSSGNLGPRQRAAALAALTSAFNSSSGKTSSPENRYIVLAGSLNGLSPKVPLYETTEGNEPCFFTTYFSWYSTKATVRCKGIPSRRRQHYYLDQTRSGNQGPRQRAAALAALTSAYYSSSGKEALRYRT